MFSSTVELINTTVIMFTSLVSVPSGCVSLHLRSFQSWNSDRSLHARWWKCQYLHEITLKAEENCLLWVRIYSPKSSNGVESKHLRHPDVISYVHKFTPNSRLESYQGFSRQQGYYCEAKKAGNRPTATTSSSVTILMLDIGRRHDYIPSVPGPCTTF